MSELVERGARAPYAAFARAVCAIERDVRLSELTPGEIDSIVGAVVAAERERCARIAEDLHKADALGEYYRTFRDGERQ